MFSQFSICLKQRHFIISAAQPFVGGGHNSPRMSKLGRKSQGHEHNFLYETTSSFKRNMCVQIVFPLPTSLSVKMTMSILNHLISQHIIHSSSCKSGPSLGGFPYWTSMYCKRWKSLGGPGGILRFKRWVVHAVHPKDMKAYLTHSMV